MSVSRTPVVAVLVLQAPMLDQNGNMTFPWLKWFQGVTQAVNNGLGTDGTALKMPYPTTTEMGGVLASTAVPSQWINQINATGVPQLSQPTVADIQGLGTGAVTDTSASAGAASALPATPATYLVLNINGTLYKAALYAL